MTTEGKSPLRLLLSACRALLRGLGLVFIALALLIAAAAFYAQRRFGPEDARKLAVEQLRSLLNGREVTIERLVLAPRGLKIKGLRVKRLPARGEGDLLVCDTALLTVKLAPLLQRRLEFDALRLESPQISMTRDAEGMWDLADLFTSSGPKRTGGPLPFALSAASTIVVDGVLRLDDLRRGRRIVFEKLQAQAEAFDQDKEFPVSLSFVNTVSVGTRTIATSFAGAGFVDLAGFKWSSATARADSFTADVDGVAFFGSASAAGFVRPVVSIDASLPAIAPDRWKRWAGRDLPLSLPETRWSARFSWPEPRLLEFERASVTTPAGVVIGTAAFDLSGDTIAVRAVVTSKELTLEKTAAWHPKWRARAPRGKAAFRLEAAGRLGAFQLKEAELTLRGFGAEWGDRKLDGVDLDASAAQEFGKVKASVSKGRFSGYQNVFEELAMSLSVARQTLVVDNLSAKWGSSRLKARGRVDKLSAPKEVLISANLDKLVWDDGYKLVTAIRASISTRAVSSEESDGRPWLTTFKYVIPRSFPDTVVHFRSGEVTQANFYCQNLDLLWTLRGVTPALDKINGEARLRFGPGRVNDIPAVQESHNILRVIFLPFIYMHKMNKFAVLSTATAYPKTLDFNRIESEYAASRGVATIRYFHVDSKQLVAYADGLADFGKERVDMGILTRLPYYSGPTLPEWWIDESGSVAIGFRVKGDLNKPELEPRFRKIGAAEIEDKLREAREKGKKRFETIEKLQGL